MASQLRRTALVAPASSPRFIASAADTAADEVVLDLEDAVAPERKAAARETLIEELPNQEWADVRLAYRINGIDSRWWYEDVIAVVSAVGELIEELVVPKVTKPSDLHTVANLLRQVEVNADLRVGAIGLQAQIEDGHGVHNVYEIAHATDRLRAIVFGPGDYSAAMGAPGLDIGQFPDYPGHYWQYALSACNAAAKSADVACVDGPYADLEDPEGLETSAANANMLGCDGKWVIHPSQIDVVNDVFAPDPAVARRARRIVDAYADAQADGTGAVTVDGQMVDEATNRMARDVLDRAIAAGVVGEEGVDGEGVGKEE